MQGSPVRVPDAIEPLIGYRAWVFEVDRNRASLFPLCGPDPRGSVWNGAHKGWVSANCGFRGPHEPHVITTATIATSVRPVPEPETCNYCDFHQVPDESCSCGFYSLKSLPSVGEPSGGGVILGAVELAGKVIEYTLGFRAERARIVELTPVAGTERDAMRLANRLGLPLTASVSPWTPVRLISGV
jgi:hypothetical protein